MGITNQRVKIGNSIETIIRCVYDIQDNETLKFQTGFVNYDNNEIPVWRPMHPSDKSMNALWRKEKWGTIYTLRMHHKKGIQYIEYALDDIEFDGQKLSLPKVTVELMYAFKKHLEIFR